MAAPTVVSTVGGLGGPVIPPYYSSKLRAHLYAQLHFRPIGDSATVPQGAGNRFKIPRWGRGVKFTAGNLAQWALSTGVITQGTAEGTLANLCSIGVDALVSGDLVRFDGAISYSDQVLMYTKANLLEGITERLTRELAFTIDAYTRNQLTAVTTNFLAGAAGTSAFTGDNLFGKEIARLAPRHLEAGVPAWQDGMYVGVTHPRGLEKLWVDPSASGFTTIYRYQQSIKVMRGEMGSMYGIRLLTSPAIPRYSASKGISAAATGSHLYSFGWQPFFTVTHDLGGLEVIHKPLGAMGADPTNVRGSLGVKFYYGTALVPAAEQRILRLAYSLT